MGLFAFIANLIFSGTKAAGSAAAKFTIEAAKFVAFRALMLFLMFAVLPYLLHNVLSGLILDLMSWSVGYLSGLDSLSVLTIELTSLGAWIGQQIGIHDCLSYYMTAVATRFVYEIGKGIFYTTSQTPVNWLVRGATVG